MDTPRFQQLGPEGVAWVRECLEQGGPLSHAVLSAIDIDTGAVLFAVAANQHLATLDNHRPLSLGVADQSDSLAEASSNLLLEKIRELDAQSSGLALIVEDNMRQPGDPHASDAALGTVYRFQNQLFGITTVAAIHDGHMLTRLLYRSSGYPLDAFIAPVSNALNDHTLDGQVITHLASHTRAIINAAYDNETFTVWLRTTVHASKLNFGV